MTDIPRRMVGQTGCVLPELGFGAAAMGNLYAAIDDASAAATLAAPAADLCANLDTQVQGGIAMTWEHDAHLYLRRAAALRGLVEAFVLREGTDYGQHEKTFESKIDDVMRQLMRGEAEILWDPASETVQLVPGRGRRPGRL